MAKNLMKNGHNVIVNDIVDSVVQNLQKEGANVAHTPAELASKVSVIITMLPSRYEPYSFT